MKTFAHSNETKNGHSGWDLRQTAETMHCSNVLRIGQSSLERITPTTSMRDCEHNNQVKLSGPEGGLSEACLGGDVPVRGIPGKIPLHKVSGISEQGGRMEGRLCYNIKNY